MEALPRIQGPALAQIRQVSPLQAGSHPYSYCTTCDGADPAAAFARVALHLFVYIEPGGRDILGWKKTPKITGDTRGATHKQVRIRATENGKLGSTTKWIKKR